MDPNKLKRKPRGTFYHACNGEVIMVKRKDNQEVNIASTIHGIEPVSSIGHYSRQKRKRIKVPISQIF